MNEPNFNSFFESFRPRLAELREEVNKMYLEENDRIYREASEQNHSFNQALSASIGSLHKVAYKETEQLVINALKDYHNWLVENFELRPKK